MGFGVSGLSPCDRQFGVVGQFQAGDFPAVLADDLARRIAAERGLDLRSIEGTGPNGRIVKADVDGATPGAAPAQAGTTSVTQAPAPAAPAKP